MTIGALYIAHQYLCSYILRTESPVQLDYNKTKVSRLHDNYYIYIIRHMYNYSDNKYCELMFHRPIDKYMHAFILCIIFIMARRAIPMIAFPRVRCMFIYIFFFLCHLREYALYTYLRKLHHSRGLGQLMGVARNRTRARALQSSRKKAACSFTSLCRNWN